MSDARIIGSGIYVPERVVTNAELSARLGTDIDEFVSTIVGIRERRIAADDESSADLATNAAFAPLQAAGVGAGELDLILLATDTPEYVSPATSVVVQERIGAVNAGTFDVNCACAGFVTTLDTAFKYIIADPSYKKVLVIGCYAMSKFIDWSDKKTSTLFADGAGAMVLQSVEDERHFLASKLVADGSYHDFMGIFAGGTKEPITESVLAGNGNNKLRFAKKYPPEVNINGWPKIVDDVLAKAGIARADVDIFLWTQVNLSTIKEVMSLMEIPDQKTHTVMGKWGYTGSACIPMVFHDAIAEGKIKRGDTVVFCGVGRRPEHGLPGDEILMEFRNIYSLFRAQCARSADRPIFYTRDEDAWKPQTWTEVEGKVLDLGCALLAKGLSKDGKAAILASNIPEWTICDIAIISAGGVGVGIYPTSSTEQANFVINHSDAEFLFVDTEQQLEKIGDTNEPYPNLKEIFIVDDSADRSIELVRERRGFECDVSEVPVTTLTRLLAYGREHREKFLPKLEALGREAKPDDVAIMVYTSGTTGEPKGAMLSHRYILNSVESLRRSVPIFDTDTSLSYLPGCHVAERISGIYNRLYNGASAYFVNDLSRLYAEMLDVKPTVFASLPRFFEKIHAAVLGKHGHEADAKALKDALGGNVRLLTSGGAPLPLEIAEFYEKRGLPILQAYGLTENICVAFNTENEHKFGTVGKYMPMCDIRIADDGEILVKSEMMFSGYYKEPKKSAEMFTRESWLKTGDLGELDADGFLKITGRKKEIIVLSTGKNVAPALIENYVKESHLISHCFVHGDGRSYCVALITVNEAEAANMCREEIQGMVEQAVARANSRVSSSEQIKRFTILDHDFSAGRDEITPTMKLKRSVVAANHKSILERLYEQV